MQQSARLDLTGEADIEHLSSSSMMLLRISASKKIMQDKIFIKIMVRTTLLRNQKMKF
jgi:hypothetical protein